MHRRERHHSGQIGVRYRLETGTARDGPTTERERESDGAAGIETVGFDRSNRGWL